MERDMSETDMDEAAFLLAQKNAMDRPFAFLPHGARLFTVQRGWESLSLKKHERTAECGTLLELEEALRDPQRRIIFIPADALIAERDIDRLCRRNAAGKTLFREEGA